MAARKALHCKDVLLRRNPHVGKPASRLTYFFRHGKPECRRRIGIPGILLPDRRGASFVHSHRFNLKGSSSSSSNSFPANDAEDDWSAAQGPAPRPPAQAQAAEGQTPGGAALGDFCIIEGPSTIQDFARMQLEEIRDNIGSRRNRIFLLMEEIRRLRIQQRLRRLEQSSSHGEDEEEEELPEYPSSIPFLPPLTASNLREYYVTFAFLVGAIIIFGGIVAPTLELKLGLGGTSYAEFIQSVGLPMQLSDVDPIVASFSGGAVGVLSALLVVEVNNVKLQEHKKCMYCYGTGYLACARCAGSGAVVVEAAEVVPDPPGAEPAVTLMPTARRCPSCAGSSKVMCPTCLCTGRALATEHDPRIDPFD